MFPSTDQVATLREYLSKGLQFAHDTEVELRFSTYSRHDLYAPGHVADPSCKPQTYRFVPVIDQSVFYRTLATFRTYNLPEHHETVTDVFFNDVRQTIDAQGNETWLTKTRGRFVDFYDYNVRASWATEIACPPLPANSHCPDHVRMKDRTSFTDGCARYDFTVVQSQDLRPGGNPKPTRTSFEIEIEFLPPTATGCKANLKHIDYAMNHIIFCTRHMLLTLQGGFADIVSLSTKHNILLEYGRLTKVRHFLGAQPETLHRHHINRVRSGYSIAEKYDGERYILFVSDNGHTYLIDRSMQVRLAPQAISSEQKGTILDVEVYDRNMFAFDVVFHRGEDLRDRADMTLLPRLVILQAVVTTLRREHKRSSAPATPAFQLHVKPHYFLNEFPKIFERWSRDAYDDGIARDGFIFTPTGEPYPSKTKWISLLKWKPADMNSIDFLLGNASESDQGTAFELLVGDKDNRNTIFEPCHAVHIHRDDPLHTVLRKGCVLECTYDNNGGMKPWRLREDKQKPNYRSVAMDVWKSMHEPVHVEDLSQSPFQSLRDFHNRVKELVVNKAVATCSPPQSSRSLRVLDLACGRGGDLHKWRKCNVSKYTGIDFSEVLLDEARLRASEIQRKYPTFDTTFYRADLRRSVDNDLKSSLPGGQVDVVSCQFALHYFYESEEAFTNFIGLITRSLKDGGVFIASLFDGYRVFDLCAKGDNEQVVSGVGFKILPHFDVRMGIGNIKSKEFSIPVAVSIDGDDDVILKTSTVEYMIFPDQLLLRMKANGFELCETKLFLDVLLPSAGEGNLRQELNNIESTYSDLHRYYVFRKMAPISSSSPSYGPLTVWTAFDPVHSTDLDEELFKDETDPPKLPELFIRSRPAAEDKEEKEDMSWITFYLDLITGRPSLPTDRGELEPDYSGLAEHYNVVISIVTSSSASLIRCVDTYKPANFLEDIKRVYFVRLGKRHHIVARECTNTRTKLLWFPSFIVADDIDSGGTAVAATTTVIAAASTTLTDMPPGEMFFDNKFTIKELHYYALSKDIKIPSTVRKKADIVTFIQNKLLT